MLQFFRKYQRFFFIVIAVVVIASFCFFGTGGVSTLSRQEDRTVIGKMLDGTRLTQEKVGRMTQFLSRSHFDFLDDRVPAPNWLNDGVIEKDFLQTSLGTMVAECVFDKVQEDLASAVRAITAFSPYRHPRAPLLTAEAIWSEFVPESNVLMTSVRSLPGEATAQTFSILTKLYLQQKAFPSLFCKRMLMMQEKQEKSLVPDEGIPYADVSLSGLHTMEEFFGTPYVQAVSQAILQGAAYARKIGLTVTTQEVRDQLLGNLQAAATRTGKEFPQDQLYAIFVQLIHGMGMEESECLALWKDVVLFRKYISSGSSLTQIDPSLVQEFYDFAKERANIECFTLPEALQLQDFSSLLQLQAYIEAVSSPRERATQISLPRKFLSLAEIEKKMPGLVQRDCVLEYACIDLKKEAASIGSKDVWAWEIEDAGWSLLTEKFAFIKNQGSVPLQDRFDELERLKEEERTLVDNFAREKILTSCEGKIKELLLTKEKTISRCSLGPKGEGLPLKEIRNKAALYAMIQALDERLCCYSEDGRYFYSIQVMDMAKEPRVLTFEEAQKCGVLQSFVDKRLEEAYPQVRKKNSQHYLRKDGAWKPLASVKDEVGLAVSTDLLHEIQKVYTQYTGKEPSEEQRTSPLFYVQYRMLIAMQEERERQGKQEDISALAAQWNFIKEEKSILKSDQEFFPTTESLALAEGDYSIPSLDQKGFFRMGTKEKALEVTPEEYKRVRALLLQETQKKMMTHLLEIMQEAGGIIL